jgi:replicative DNA helicase
MTVMTKMVMIHGCRLIFVDYLQLISAPGKGDNKSIEIGVITRALKMFAKNYGVDVVLLSQLNRSLETRTDKRPKLSDLRESGNIEQDADLVMFVYRDEYYNENTTTPGIMEIIVAKNRHGKTGTVSLYYQEEISMIASLSRDEE